MNNSWDKWDKQGKSGGRHKLDYVGAARNGWTNCLQICFNKRMKYEGKYFISCFATRRENSKQRDKG